MKLLKLMLLVVATWMLAQGAAFADDELLKPFVLGSKGPGMMAERPVHVA